MSYAERLAQAVNKAPARETFHTAKKVYEWTKESSQKRSVR